MAYGMDDFLGSDGYSSQNKKPIWTIDLDDKDKEKDILQWLKQEKSYLEYANQKRIQTIYENISLYKGIHYLAQDYRSSSQERNTDKARTMRKIVVNDLYDLTEQRVSRLLKFKPGIAILPANDEFQDKTNAKIVKAILDTIWYQTQFETRILEKAIRVSDICGESYTFIEWDPNKGDYHPDYIKLKEENGNKTPKIPLIKKDGTPVTDEMGEQKFIEEAIHVGDVDYKVVLPYEIFLENTQDYADCNYMFREELEITEYLKNKFPDIGDKISESSTETYFDIDTLQDMPVMGKTKISHFYHKKCKEMPSGRYIVYVNDAILINIPFPYSMENEFPCERLTDIEIPGELHARSFFSQTKQLQAQLNNLTTMIVRNQLIAAHPKWVMPVGAANIESLGNDITIVQYKGPIAPQLVQSNPTPSEIFAFRDKIREDLLRLSGIGQASIGQPPPGVKSGIAIQYLSEQEQERSNSRIVKFNEYVRKSAQKTIMVAGDYYDDSDQRMLRLLGKANQWLTSNFDKAVLSRPYDVRIQNSSALPNSKAGRTQTIIDLSQSFPGILSNEQVLDILDLAQSDKFFDLATQSIRMAEAENEKFMDVQEVLPPEVEEDHITMWKTHIGLLRDLSFKENASPEQKMAVKDHIMAHEMFMFEAAGKNPAYQEKLLPLDGFPLFFVPAAPPPPVQAAPMPQEQAPITEEEVAQMQALDGIQQPNIEEQLPVGEELPLPEATPIELQ